MAGVGLTWGPRGALSRGAAGVAVGIGIMGGPLGEVRMSRFGDGVEAGTLGGMGDEEAAGRGKAAEEASAGPSGSGGMAVRATAGSRIAVPSTAAARQQASLSWEPFISCVLFACSFGGPRPID